MAAKILTHFAVLLAVICLLALVMALPTMWLWNGCAVDAVTVLRPITFLQALGLNLLCGILFRVSASAKGS